MRCSPSPAAAIRPLVLGNIASIAEIPAAQWPGEIGYLALISPTVHRLSLEMTDRQAAVISRAIIDTTDVTAGVARLHGIALPGVFQIIYRRVRTADPGLPAPATGRRRSAGDHRGRPGRTGERWFQA